jgi:3-oxoacyl-(acyl-carrier-protein) synthase
MGAWTAAGMGVDALWRAALAGRGLATWQAMPPSVAHGCLPVCAAPTPGATQIPLRKARRADRSIRFALAAAWEAWRDAGLDRSPVAPERIAIVAGTSRGPVWTAADAVEQLARGQMRPSTAAHATLASLSGTLAELCGAAGPSFVVSAACASSATAMATAAQLLLSGVADVALAGGAEAPLHPAVLAQLHAAGVLAMAGDPARACRPFDTGRSGTVLGEGAGFLVLETAASALARKVRSHARLAGWGLATEPGERAGMSDDSHGLVRAMQDALGLAGLPPEAIGHVNAHGTGTVLNDRQEARAMVQVFSQGTSPWVCSTKPVTGHCMGAAAALESILAIQAMNTGWVPPTANCDTPDPGCALPLVRTVPQPCASAAVMTNSSGFWGNHASLVFAKSEAP